MNEMKESGVEWLGQVPSQWEIKQIKNLFELRNEKNYEDLKNVNLISLYTDRGVVQHCDLEKTTGNKAVTADGYKKVYQGDIVVNIILCWMGAVGRSDYTGVTSPAYDIYRPKDGTQSRYYHYLFRTNQFSGECFRYGRGIMLMRWRTYSTEFSAIQVPCPPADIQSRIVSILDKKCLQIDELIANVQSQIDKLKAYKHSLITEVVTKGLDKTVPMKDSGVDWIGTIPEHWETKPLLREIESIADYRGKTPEKVDEGVLLVTARNIKDGIINYSISREYVKPEEYDIIMRRGKLNIGDVLFTTEAPSL